jgi:hypothetical protein
VRPGNSKAWLAWKRMAQRIASVQARLVLGLLYFIVLFPFAMLSRIGTKPFAHGWVSRDETGKSTRESALKQS